MAKRKLPQKVRSIVEERDSVNEPLNLFQLIEENGGKVPKDDGFSALFWIWLMAYLRYERNRQNGGLL